MCSYFGKYGAGSPHIHCLKINKYICGPLDCSPSVSSEKIHRIFQARIRGGLPFLSPTKYIKLLSKGLLTLFKICECVRITKYKIFQKSTPLLQKVRIAEVGGRSPPPTLLETHSLGTKTPRRKQQDN